MPTTMKALKIGGKNRLSVVEVPIPEEDGEKVIIRVNTSGICGSDIHMWEEGKPKGLIPGHELAGTVVDSGSRDDLNPGDRVTVIPLNPCGECSWCRDSGFHICKQSLKRGIPGVSAPGSYAEYFKARPDMVRKLPDTLSHVEATMIEPAAVALHAVNLANIEAGEKVLIVGGGVIGLLCAAWARIYGASFVGMSETNESRGAKALELGDIHAWFDANDPQLTSTILKRAKGLFDIAIDCSGSASGINAAIDVLNHQGTLLLVGISFAPVPVLTLPVCRKELRLIGDMGYSVPEFEHTIDMMSRGMIHTKRFVDDQIALDEVQGAFERLSSGNSPEVKILIQPSVLVDV